MYLIYTDEAGNTGAHRDPDQPIHMIGAMLVEDDKVEAIARQFADVMAARFPDIFWQKEFELHGSDVFGGSGLFKTVKPEVRIAACDDVFDILIREEIPIMWAAIDKLKSGASEHPHSLAFRLLAKRLDDFLRVKDSLGLIIADENKEMEQKVIDDLVRYKRTSAGWGYGSPKITKIIDSVHFVQSKNNPNIQIIDLVTYFLNKGLRIEGQIIAASTTDGLGLSYEDHLKAHPPKPAYQAVLRLCAKIRPQVVGTKRFP